MDHGVVAELAREAERLGYTSFWFNDIPHAEGLASVAAAAEATTSIPLAVGVIPLDARPPAAIAERVTSLGVPRERLWLGVGSGHSPHALARVRTGVGELQGVAAKVIVGALGPKMAAVAGEADGVLLNWMTPDFAAVAGQWTLDAAAPSGRRPSLMSYVRCGFAPAAEQRLDEELARYTGVASFEDHVRRMGVSGRQTCVLAPDAAALQSGIAPYESVLDETIVRAITPTDSLADLLDLLRACAPTV